MADKVNPPRRVTDLRRWTESNWAECWQRIAWLEAQVAALYSPRPHYSFGPTMRAVLTKINVLVSVNPADEKFGMSMAVVLTKTDLNIKINPANALFGTKMTVKLTKV